MNGTLGKELVGKIEELEPSKALELGSDLVGEDLVSLSSKLVNFSNYLGMPVAGCEKEINSFLSLLWNLESRKGHEVKVLGRKRILPSSFCFEREI